MNINSNIEIQKIIHFVEQIGLQVIHKNLPDDTFLPGLALGAGCIYLDIQKLQYHGDILHEAGHLAVTPRAQREAVGTSALELPWPTAGEEIGAILWSYAAAMKIGLPLETVFHSGGYKNDGTWLQKSFESGNYIGLPFLAWAGLCLSETEAIGQPHLAFPVMQKWIRD